MLPIRESIRGTLSAYILQERVWVRDGEEEEAHCGHLIVRLEIDSPNKIKYRLSNVSKDSSIELLAFMQGQRFRTSRALQDGKGECGLGCLPGSRLEWLAAPYDACNDGDVVHAETSFVKQR